MNSKKSFLVKGIIGLVFASSSLLAFAEEEKAQMNGRFEIVRFDVQGSTLLSEQEIDQMLAPFAGKDQNFGSVQKAVEALESAYRKRGFNVVQVILPEQELNHGVVQMKVVEARIGKVSVAGNKFFDEANIKRSFPTLKEGESPNMIEVTRNLKLANENPQKKNTVQLHSQAQEGVIDAVIQVADEKPWAAAVSLDNTGDLHTGRNRITGLLQHANIGGLDHILSMQYGTSVSHPDDVTIFGAGYHIPLYSLGDSLDFYTSYSNVDSGIVNAGGFGFAVSGNGTVYGTRYNHNFTKNGDYESSLSAGLDYKAFRNDISLSDVALGHNVTVHPISLTYSGNWAVVGTTLNFMLAGFHNIPGGTHGSEKDFEAARIGANKNYNIVRYTGVFAHAFKGDWQVRFILNGQITPDALVQGEQFGMGGASSVRGFFERELADDDGFTTNLELYTPNLCSGNLQCRLLSFYDAGYLSRNNALPEEITHQSIGSVGLGFRVSLAPNWAAQTDWAYVVDGSTFSPTGSNRAHFKLILTF